jgi:hypothetical protein
MDDSFKPPRLKHRRPTSMAVNEEGRYLDASGISIVRNRHRVSHRFYGLHNLLGTQCTYPLAPDYWLRI